MKLTPEQQAQLREERGICADEACDKCGAILGCVRYTRRGERGEWCSELCRDGQAATADRAERRTRKGGRPPKYRDEAARKQANSVYQRAYRRRSVLA